MRVKEMIYLISSNQYYIKYKDVVSCDAETFYKRLYHHYIKLGWYGDQMRCNYIQNNLHKYIPEYKKYLTFEYGIWGKVQIYVNISVYNAHRFEGIKAKMSFDCINMKCNPIDLITIDIPLSLSLDDKSLQEFAHNHLLKFAYKEGVLGYLQSRYKLTKKETVIRYKRIVQHQKDTFRLYDIETIKKSIKKHFNIDSYVSLNDTIKIVNQIGKQKVIKVLQAFDYGMFDDFDGDIDELETEFYGNLQDNIIYI